MADDLLELAWVRQAAPQVEDGVPRGTCTGRTQDDESDVDTDDCHNGEYDGDSDDGCDIDDDDDDDVVGDDCGGDDDR